MGPVGPFYTSLSFLVKVTRPNSLDFKIILARLELPIPEHEVAQ